MSEKNTLLSCIENNPEVKPMGSVIWLHGLGADANDFVPIIPELKMPSTIPLRFVFPSAPSIPVTINNGYVMPAWYDITSLDINQRVDLAGINASVKEVEKLIERENNLGIPTDKIILAGFSQGAVVALATGLSHSAKLAGILALSGYLSSTTPDINEANKKTQIFIAHGMQDVVVPYQIGLMSYSILNRLGLNATWRSYNMAHSVCNDEIHDIATWLREIF